MLTLLAFLSTGCGLDDLMRKTREMTTVIQATCDCDDVRLLSYEDNMAGEITAYFEILGADVDKHEKIASKINESLKGNIKGYCDIDELTLDFINKGKHDKILFGNCKLKGNMPADQ